VRDLDARYEGSDEVLISVPARFPTIRAAQLDSARAQFTSNLQSLRSHRGRNSPATSSATCYFIDSSLPPSVPSPSPVCNYSSGMVLLWNEGPRVARCRVPTNFTISSLRLLRSRALAAALAQSSLQDDFFLGINQADHRTYLPSLSLSLALSFLVRLKISFQTGTSSRLEVPGEREVPARIRSSETTSRLLPQLHSQPQTKLSPRKFNSMRLILRATASEYYSVCRFAASRIFRISRAIPIDISCVR